MAQNTELAIGDTIKCINKEEMVNVSMELANNDIQTDFLFEKDGQKGLWLVVTGLEHILDLDEVKTKMCDSYCKYPCIVSDQGELDEICKGCPLEHWEA